MKVNKAVIITTILLVFYTQSKASDVATGNPTDSQSDQSNNDTSTGNNNDQANYATAGNTPHIILD